MNTPSESNNPCMAGIVFKHTEVSLTWHQNGTKMAQNRPKRPKIGPKMAQNRHKVQLTLEIDFEQGG